MNRHYHLLSRFTMGLLAAGLLIAASPPSASEEDGEFEFIQMCDTQLWKAPVAGESEKHDAWFVRTLKEAKAKDSPVVIVVHHPLFLKKPDEEEAYFNIGLEKRREILDLCEEHGVVAFLGGHTHKLVINEYKGIQLVNGETTSKNSDKRPMGFRHWNAKPGGKVEHRFVKLEGMDDGAKAKPAVPRNFRIEQP